MAWHDDPDVPGLTLTRRLVPTKRVQMPMSDTSMMHACTMYHVEGRGGRRCCMSIYCLWSLLVRIVCTAYMTLVLTGFLRYTGFLNEVQLFLNSGARVHAVILLRKRFLNKVPHGSLQRVNGTRHRAPFDQLEYQHRRAPQAQDGQLSPRMDTVGYGSAKSKRS